MKTQLELGFDGCRTTRVIAQRKRVPGARWWFQQMHSIVDQAMDWKAVKAPAQQTYLSFGAVKPARRCA